MRISLQHCCFGLRYKRSENYLFNKLGSFYRPPPFTSYHHLLADPASAAATRPLLLAAGLYGASSLAIPPPIPPPPPIPGIASIASGNEHERRSASTGGPLDLSHLTASAQSQSMSEAMREHVSGNSAGGAGGKLPRATSMHSLLGLQKSSGNKFSNLTLTLFLDVKSIFKSASLMHQKMTSL